MIRIFKNALKTDRAFIHYDKIQHISWNQNGVLGMELKVYSSAGTIIQYLELEDLERFLDSYIRDWLGVGGFAYEWTKRK